MLILFTQKNRKNLRHAWSFVDEKFSFSGKASGPINIFLDLNQFFKFIPEKNSQKILEIDLQKKILFETSEIGKKLLFFQNWNFFQKVCEVFRDHIIP